MELYHRYGVTRIFGLRYGYEGLVPRLGHVPLALRPESVSTIHTFGGTILGSSRGRRTPAKWWITWKNSAWIYCLSSEGMERCREARGSTPKSGEGASKSVIGIPKTIDNDIMYLDKSFGFDTAFAEAVKTVSCAHVEAMGG